MDKLWFMALGKKIIETIISVKVLTITAVLIISTKLVVLNLLTGSDWAFVNGGVIATVFALREGMKIAKVHRTDLLEKEESKSNKEIRYIRVKSDEQFECDNLEEADSGERKERLGDIFI